MNIRTKILHGKVDILLISGMPEDTNYISVILGDLFYAKEEGDWNVFSEHNMPSGNWQPVNWIDKVSEDEAKELVDYFTTDEDFGKEDVFRDYKNKSFFGTAKESLLSLVEANVKTMNKYGNKPVLKTEKTHYDDFAFPTKEGIRKWKEWEDEYKAWEAEEAQVWKNIYLLKKKIN